MDNIKTAKDIRRMFRTRMDGVIAANMRNKGVDYKINWGISLMHLRELAAECTPDLHVALELWGDSVRESKIMALLLMPVEEMTSDIADLWIDSLPTQELAELSAMILFHKLPYAPDLAFRLIADKNELKQILGYSILSRLFSLGQMPNDRGVAEVRDQAETAINAESVSLRHAAHNCLMKLENSL